MAKSIHEILESASTDQIRAWYPAVVSGRWPETMPLPRELFSTVWHSLQKKYYSLPLEVAK